MNERIKFRLQDIEGAVRDIRELLDNKTIDVLHSDRVTRAAFERFLEIASEASRHIPDDWKTDCAPEIPWRRVADLGNQLRHGYKELDVEILWSIYEDISTLELAVERMLGRYFPDE